MTRLDWQAYSEGDTIPGPRGPSGFVWFPSDMRDRDVSNAWGARVFGVVNRYPPTQRWRPLWRSGGTLFRLIDGFQVERVDRNTPCWRRVRDLTVI